MNITIGPGLFLFFMCLPALFTVGIAKDKGRSLVKWGAFGLLCGFFAAIGVDVAVKENLAGFEGSMVLAAWMWVLFSVIPIVVALLFPSIKYCLSCREAIRQNAIVCKHCGAGRPDSEKHSN